MSLDRAERLVPHTAQARVPVVIRPAALISPLRVLGWVERLRVRSDVFAERVAVLVAEHLEVVLDPRQAGIELGGILRTGIGDGCYPIEVRYATTPFGRRIAEVRIKFWPHPALGRDVPGS